VKGSLIRCKFESYSWIL